MNSRGSGIERLGAIRGPIDSATGFKEWLHVCATGANGFLLLNLSHEQGIGRAIVIAGRAGGSVARVVEPSRGDWRFDPGRAAARVGGCSFEWVGDRVELTVGVDDEVVVGSLELRAIAAPAWTGSIPMPPGAELNWVVAPRWRVTGGSLRIAGEHLDVGGWQGYHDHNWGCFRWADDFAWEWAFGFGEDVVDPGCVVFGRLTDRVGARVLSKVLMLWWGGVQLRTFRGGDVQVQLRGRASLEGCRPVPGPAGLLLPRALVGVPEEIRVEAGVGHDRVSARFRVGCTHRVVVPEDGAPTGYRVLHECFGGVEAEGQVAGRGLRFGGPGGVEVLRHG